MRHPLLGILCLAAVTATAHPTHAQPTVWAHLDSATRLLPPDAFPALPAVVRRDLARRGCRVPQASGPDVDPEGQPASRRPRNNVVRGAFRTAGARDWAVLCSVAGASRILVYADGRAEAADSLAHAPDGGFLYQEPGHDWGYYRIIGSASAGLIRRSYAAFGGRTPPARLDHRGIEDAFAGKGSEVHYFYRGRWLLLQGVD